MKHAFLVAMVTFFSVAIFLIICSVYTIGDDWILITAVGSGLFAFLAFFVDLLIQENEKQKQLKRGY